MKSFSFLKGFAIMNDIFYKVEPQSMAAGGITLSRAAGRCDAPPPHKMGGKVSKKGILSGVTLKLSSFSTLSLIFNYFTFAIICFLSGAVVMAQYFSVTLRGACL